MNREQIFKYVCERYDVTEQQIKGKSRKAHLIKPRHVTMFMLKEIKKYSFPQIGRMLGGRDHSTIIHGYNSVKELIETGQLDIGIEIKKASKKNHDRYLSTLDKSVKEALLLFRIKMLQSFEKDPFGTLIKLTKALDE